MSQYKDTKLKYLVSINTEHAESNEGYVGLENVESWSGKKIETDTPEAEGVALSYQKGDILFGKLRPYLAKCYVAEEAACCSTEFLVMRPKKVVSKYLQYRILSAEFIDKVNMSTYGAKMPRANWSFIGNLKMDVPSMEEQQAIAIYLDDRCSKIDAIIAEAKASIEEYNELKQTVIYEAVTKGLDKDVEMKDSGNKWIGKIPVHWVMNKMNRLCNTITDYVASGSFASLAENVTYLDYPDYAMLIRTADISGKRDSAQAVYVDEKAYNFLSNSNLFGGEIILPNIGASVGDVYIVPKLYEHMTLAPNSIMVRTNQIDKYYYYFFTCDAGRQMLLNIAESAAQAKFNKTDLRQLRLPQPTINEQNEIVRYLDKKANKLDALINEKQSLIEDLEAYKKSLIYEVVTGKRKVVE